MGLRGVAAGASAGPLGLAYMAASVIPKEDGFVPKLSTGMGSCSASGSGAACSSLPPPFLRPSSFRMVLLPGMDALALTPCSRPWQGRVGRRQFSNLSLPVPSLPQKSGSAIS